MLGSSAEALRSRAEGDISYCCRVKMYPNGALEVMAAEKPIFHDDGWECSKKAIKRKPMKGAAEDLERSRRRAISKVRDYALCSDFEWFVTLTLDKDLINRFDYAEVMKKLSTYCSNSVQRKGLRYVLVTELHEDGALHFHGFFGGLPEADYVPSGTYTGGCVPLDRKGRKKPRRPRSAKQLDEWVASGAKEVYNLKSWKFGFTTAVKLDAEYDKAVTYVTKYIRKEQTKVGGRWYLSGGDLKTPDASLHDLSYEEVAAMENSYTFAVPGCGYAMWRGKASDFPLSIRNTSLTHFDAIPTI